MADAPIANVLLMAFGSGEDDPIIAVIETLAEDLDVASVAIQHDCSLRWDFVLSDYSKRLRAVNELLRRKEDLAQSEAVERAHAEEEQRQAAERAALEAARPALEARMHEAVVDLQALAACPYDPSRRGCAARTKRVAAAAALLSEPGAPGAAHARELVELINALTTMELARERFTASASAKPGARAPRRAA